MEVDTEPFQFDLEFNFEPTYQEPELAASKHALTKEELAHARRVRCEAAGWTMISRNENRQFFLMLKAHIFAIEQNAKHPPGNLEAESIDWQQRVDRCEDLQQLGALHETTRGRPEFRECRKRFAEALTDAVIECELRL